MARQAAVPSPIPWLCRQTLIGRTLYTLVSDFRRRLAGHCSHWYQTSDGDWPDTVHTGIRLQTATGPTLYTLVTDFRQRLARHRTHWYQTSDSDWPDTVHTGIRLQTPTERVALAGHCTHWYQTSDSDWPDTVHTGIRLQIQTERVALAGRRTLVSDNLMILDWHCTNTMTDVTRGGRERQSIVMLCPQPR